MPRARRTNKRNISNPFSELNFSDITLPPGSNGRVFVMEAADGKKFVMKVIDRKLKEKDLEGTEETALRKVKSDFVIPLIERREDRHFVYFLFPYVKGSDLKTVLESRDAPFSSDEIRGFMKQMAQAVIDMDRAGVIHQDIKPRNIRITPEGNYVLLDLGIARFKKAGKKGVTRGAYGYCSPEQIYGAIEIPNRPPTTFSADHWAIGTIAYQMATLHHPFDNSERKVMNDPVVDPRKFNSNLDERLAEIILTLLKKHASERYPTAQMFLDALNGARMELPTLFEGKGVLHSYRRTRVSREFISQYKEKVGSGDHLPGGFVLPAQSMAKNTKPIEKLRAHGYRFLIDPETYYPFLRAGASDTQQFFRKQRQDALIQREIGIQQDNGADYFITPYLFIESVEGNELALTPVFYEESLKLLRDSGLTTPLLGGLFVARSIVVNDASRRRLLDELLPATDGLAGIYLIAETLDTGSAQVNDGDFLRSLREMVEALSPKLPIVLGYGDVFALGLIPSGLSAIVTHPYSSARKINVPQIRKNMKSKTKKGGKGGMPRPPAQFYAPNLLNFIRVTGELDEILANNRDSVVACDCPFCTPELFHRAKSHRDILQSAWREEDRFNHYMFSMARDVQDMKSMPPEKSRQHFIERIDRAKDFYRGLAEMELHEHSRGDFLETWKTSFS